MGDNHESLIIELIKRLCQEQRSASKQGTEKAYSQEQQQQQQIFRSNGLALVELSKSKLDVVLDGLTEKIKAGGLSEELQTHLLKLMKKCMQVQLEKVRAQQKEEKEVSRDLLLSEQLAAKIFALVQTYLLKAPQSKSDDLPPLYQRAGEVLFHLSALSPDAIFPKTAIIIEKGPEARDNDETANQYLMIQHLDLNSKRLTSLLTKVSQSVAAYGKKSNLQVLLAKVLRKAIWNWIDNYPQEFVQLSKSGHRFGGFPDQLFDTFLEWSNKHKSIMPLLSMLLVLCPDIMIKIAKQEKHDSIATKEKFMEGLKKSLKNTKLSDISAICYVDICKAATFVSKSDMSALRYIAPAIESDLNERLFDPKNPYKNSEGEVDLELMTDWLAASYKLNSKKVASTLFVEFLKPESPAYFKLVLVKALQILEKEEASQPWNPSLAESYPTISSKLRGLFQEYVGGLLQLDTITDKKKQTQIQADIPTMQHMLELFKDAPDLPLFSSGTSASHDIEVTKHLLVGICDCVSRFNLPELSDAAAETLLVLHQPKNIQKWSAKSVIEGYWDVSSAVSTSLCNYLLKADSKPANTLKLITILEAIQKHRNDFLASQQAAGAAGEAAPAKNTEAQRLMSGTKLETALLVLLCNGDPDICSRAATCFGLLCDEIDIVGEENPRGGGGRHGSMTPNMTSLLTANSFVSNYQVYRKIASSGVLSTGRVAQQLAIRKLLRRVERQTNGNFAAWQEVYERFTVYTPVVASYDEGPQDAQGVRLVKKKSEKELVIPKQLSEKTQTEVQDEWKNILGFLVAILAVCLNKLQSKKITDAPKLKHANSMSSLPVLDKGIKVIDSFLDELLLLLTSDTKYVRETVMSLTGTSISHTAYPVLFRSLLAQVKKFFGESGQIIVNQKSVLYVDQSISLVKHVLEVPQEGEHLALLADFEALMETFVKFVSGLAVDETSLRIKRTLCQLVQAMMAKRQFISFRNEMRFRNTLVKNIMEWTSDFTQNPNADLKKMMGDLDIEAMKALSSLLRGLGLGDGEDNEASATEQKNNRFTTYFKFFTSRLKKEDSKSNASANPMAEFTIQCLSNMLAANIDAGLKYFVTMGYHEDYATRTAFLKVITNILSQGTEFDNSEESEDKYDKLLELLFDTDLALITSLIDAVPVGEADDVATLLVRIFEANDKLSLLMKAAIEHEVSTTAAPNTLFRRNSLSTKILSACAKENGSVYLKELISPLLHQLIANPATYEIDPLKIPESQNLETNLANVVKASQMFIDAITSSVEYSPPQFREICHYLQSAVGRRFPGFETAAIGGFLFLRFICPAIVSPEAHNLVTEIPNQDLRRGLVLVTKTLQSIANNLQYEQNKKEPYMASLSKYIEDNTKSMSATFLQFAQPGTATAAANAGYTDEQRDADLGVLHHFIATFFEKIGRNLQNVDQKKRPTVYDRLTLILQKLGPAPEHSLNKSGTMMRSNAGVKGENNSLYEDFMKSKANLNTEKIREKNIFYRQGTSKERYPVFYLISRRFKKDDRDVELDSLLFYMLKTVQSALGKPFVLVVDCTLFSANNQLPLSWLSYINQHLPATQTEEDIIDKIIFLNPNKEFKKYSKHLKKFVGRNQMKKITFISNALQLSNFIPENEIGLPAETIVIEKEVKASFSPVQRVSQVQQKEYVLRVSPDYLQLLAVKPENVLGKSAVLIDLIHVSSIEEILTTGEESEFVIRCSNTTETKPLILKSAAWKQIIERLNASKSLHKLATTGAVGRTLGNPSDVPGTLLNMALLNIGISDSPSLRLAAYNMLCSLCTNFKFSVQSQLLGTTGLFVPPNSFQFVIGMSQKLASTQPDLTLEFLMECLQGLNLNHSQFSIKQLSLAYMKPWLLNLSRFYRLTGEILLERTTKAKQFIGGLIELTIADTEITTMILESAWKTLGTVVELTECIVDCCIEQALKYKEHPKSFAVDTIGSILATAASQNSQLISGKLIARLMYLISATAPKSRTGSTSLPITLPIQRLDDHESWPSIAVVLKLVYCLSFDNLLHVQQYLPELFHIIMMVFGTGTVESRAITHSLLVNVVHSLYTITATAEEKLQGLRFHLSEFNQPQFKLHFGLGGQSATLTEKKLDRLSIPTADTVANALYSVLSAVSPGNDPVGTAWHSRWLSLTSQAAFNSNLALQPRACVTLGVICRSKTLVTDELMELVIVGLKEALRDTTYDGDDDLAVSFIMCLTRLYQYLPVDSPYFKVIFWVSISIIQISDAKLFNAAVYLLEVILKVQDEQEGFKKGIDSCYMSLREGPGAIDQILSKLDQITGLSFKSSFSFGIAGNLVKGLKLAKTKESTSRLLSLFLDITVKNLSAPALGINILGYLAALLPMEGDLPILREITWTKPSSNLFDRYYSEQLLPDDKHAALLFTFLVTILEHTDKDHEQMFIYDSLKEGVKFNASAFCVVETILFPMMAEVIQKTQNPALIQAVHSILETAYTFKQTKQYEERLSRPYLNEIGYHKLPDCATFDNIEPSMKREITKLVILLLENILKEIKSVPTNL